MNLLLPLERARSISLKLRLIILTICGVMLFLASVAATLYDNHRSRLALQQKVETMAQILVSQSAAVLVFGDADAAQENLAALVAVPAVLGARLLRRDKSALALYRRNSEQPLPQCGRCDSAGVHWASDHMALLQPIVLEGRTVGWLEMRVGLVALKQQTLSYMALSLGMLVFALLGATVLALWLQRSITQPVLHLAEGMRQVTETGDYSVRITPQTEDELGRLTQGFNTMLGRIAEQERALARHQQELEDLVTQRTRELRQSMERVHHLAFFDELTGLANRMLFCERLDLTIAHARQNRDRFAVLFFDLDRFKRVNDSFGHHIGDLLLQEVAKRLQACLRQTDRVSVSGGSGEHAIARQGGDEFTLLLSELKSPEDAARVAHRIIDTLARPISLEGYELVTTTSIGIAIYPDDGETSAQLLKNADAAMYHAKTEGRNNFQFFRDTLHQGSMRRLEVESELRLALDSGQFAVHFQPLVDLKAGTVYGAEALLRWTHPRLGAVPPTEFIPVAEECDLIGPLTAFVLDQVGRCLERWRQLGLPPLRVSVNVSGARFGQQRLVEMVRAAMQRYRLAPQQLMLELTEHCLMQNRQETLDILRALEREGVAIAIDDFGTGYSSLAYLKSFPVHTLKIDKSFVDEVTTDSGDAAITRAITAMAQSLELEVVAEGVETREQRDFLLQLGCSRLQGYFFGRPMPAADFERLLVAGEVPEEVPQSQSRFG